MPNISNKAKKLELTTLYIYYIIISHNINVIFTGTTAHQSTAAYICIQPFQQTQLKKISNGFSILDKDVE